jgi:uncharacterized membrane protein
MKYTTEVIINLPLQQVIELFDDPDNMKFWMEGLKSFEHISGTPGQAGAKSKLKFQTGRKEIVMIETITVRNLPEEFTGVYEVKGVFNVVKNSFTELSGKRTHYKTENEFRFTGIMRLIAPLMKGAFKKQSHKYQNDFRLVAEKLQQPEMNYEP